MLNEKRIIPSSHIPKNEAVHDWFPNDNHPAIFVPMSRGGVQPLLTYSELRNELLAAPNLAPTGTRIGVLIGNADAALLALVILSIMDQGCVACPLPAGIAQPRLVEAVEQLGIECIVCTKAFHSRCQSVLSTVHPVALESEVGHQVLCWPEQLPKRSQTEFAMPSASLILRTSGTTAQPKVVPLSAEALRLNALAIAESLQLSRRDVCLNVMPYFHIGGLSCALLAVLCAGSQVICGGVFEPESFADWLQHATPAPTWYYAVPTIHKTLVLHIQRSLGGRIDTSLRLVRSGAAHLPREDALELARIFGCAVVPTYSMSECMPVCSVPPGFQVASRADATVGPPIGPTLRIIEAEGASADALPVGQVGEVVLSGPGVFGGYEGSDGSEFIRDGSLEWFRTGDLGLVDEQGWVTLKGRLKEVVKRGGEQVSLFEVDEALLAHPAVEVAAAFPVENEFWGQEVAAVVVLSSSAKEGCAERTEKELISFLAGKFDDFKVPRQIVLAQSGSQIPKGPTGKFLRSRMAEELGVTAKDLDAMKLFVADSGSTIVPTAGAQSPNALVVPSSALYGIRFITACFVVQHHVGVYPTLSWMAVQSFTINMTIFMLLAGFMMAASTQQKLEQSERLDFVSSRLAAAHPLFVFSICYGLPGYIMRCNPSLPARMACSEIQPLGIQLTSWETYVPHLLFSLFLYITGIASVWPNFLFTLANSINGPIWFQFSYYALVLMFPYIDAIFRKGSVQRHLGFVLVILLVCASTLFLGFAFAGLIFLNYYFLTWIPCFMSGVGLWHYFFKHVDSGKEYGRAWGLLADTLSLVYLGVVATVVVTADTKGQTYDEWMRYSYLAAGGRLTSQLGTFLGFLRLNTVTTALWIYALAHGRGVTATLFSQPWLVKHLSPLSYAIYLLHVPTAYYLYYAVRGLAFLPLYVDVFAGFPFPLEWWALPVTILVSACLGAGFNEYINPWLVPYAMRYFRWAVGCFPCCASRRVNVSDATDPESNRSTLDIVAQCVRGLTGAVVDSGTSLEVIGLDSFGTTALVGALRQKLPAAKTLKPSTIRELGTVGALVDELGGLQ